MDRFPSSGLIEVLITIPFNEMLIDTLRRLSPRVRLHSIPARKIEDVPNEIWGRVEVLYTDRVLPPPALVPNLHWVQYHYAGMDSIAENPLMKKSDVVFTSLSGAAALQMAEYAMWTMLAMGHRTTDLLSTQMRGEWPANKGERFRPQELRGSTVGIIGYGSIGRELARLLQPWGVQILAVKKNAMQPADHGYIAEGLGDPQGDLFTRLYPVQALCSVLKESDFVVVALPQTRETRGLIGTTEIAAMKPSAYLIDFGRGGVVDHAALIPALQERRIAGAALDVFPEEPLPTGSLLWRLPNVMITPHIGGLSQFYNQRAISLFMENLQRYLAGEPLFNRYDPEQGY